MKVGFATTDWSQSVPDETEKYPTIGGAGWYRMKLPHLWLADHGIETVIGRLGGDNNTGTFHVLDWDDARFEPDIVVIQRYMHQEVVEFTRRARAAGQVVVNDLDDWFFGLDPKNHAYRSTHPKHNADVNRDHYRHALGASSAITVTTPFLQERIRSMFPKVRVELLRNAIDLERWKPKHISSAPPVIGWVGGAPWRSGDLTSNGAIAGHFANANGLRFHHSGKAEQSADFFARAEMGELTSEEERLAKEWFRSAGEVLGADLRSSRPMCAIHEYPAMFDPIDIGIVPLADVPFNHAKSAIKAMEYAASGIPFVAQALPEQDWLRREHGIGRTAWTAKRWYAELNKMLDVGWRQEQRDRNLDGVANLDMAKRGLDWLSFYESLLA